MRRVPPVSLLLVWGIGCTSPVPELHIDASLSEQIPTVGTAVVAVDADDTRVSDAWIEASLDGVVRHRFPATPGQGGWAAQLLGLKAGRDYSLEAVAVIDGAEVRGGQLDLVTGQAPDVLPSIFVEVPDPDHAIEGYLFTALQAGWAMPVVLDTEGDVVWWHYPSEDQEVVNAGRPMRDGSGVIYTRNQSDWADLVRVSWDGSDEQVTPVPKMNHDFTELPDGTVAYIAYDPLVIDDTLVYGDAIMEVRPDGQIDMIWTVYDDFPFDPDWEIPEGSTWSHANALDYDEETDSYLLGLRNFDTIVEIDRSSRTLVRRISGEGSDYATADGETQLFDQQHQFQMTAEDRILVFDNGDETGERTSAREYRLDDETGLAEQIWRYQTDPALYCFSLGDVIRLDDGDTIVVWSTAGQVDHVDPDGNLRWRMNGGIGAAFGYTTFRESFLGD